MCKVMTKASWAVKIETVLRRAPVRYSTTKANAWEPYPITAQLTYTYRSRHNCQAIPEELQIFHILLRFY